MFPQDPRALGLGRGGPCEEGKSPDHLHSTQLHHRVGTDRSSSALSPGMVLPSASMKRTVNSFSRDFARLRPASGASVARITLRDNPRRPSLVSLRKMEQHVRTERSRDRKENAHEHPPTHSS